MRGALDQLARVNEPLEAAANAIAQSFATGGKLLAAGNGGSAAEAQHLTGELLGRLHPSRERGALPAVALHADTSTLTAIGNDYGYDRIFARQVEAYGRPADVLVVLSTSGASPNLVAAVDAAAARGMVTVGLLGPVPRVLHETCTHVLAVPADDIQTIQECHLVLVHALVEMVEERLGMRGSDTTVPGATARRDERAPSISPSASTACRSVQQRMGIMQGRLVPSANGQLDCSPAGRWREEFWSAGALGLNHIELVADRHLDYGNPLWSVEGREEMTRLADFAGVATASLCYNEILATPLDQLVEHCVPRLKEVVTRLPIQVLVLPMLEASELRSLGMRSAARAVRTLVDQLVGDQLHVVVELGVPADESLGFLEEVAFPGVGLCYDVGNATAFGYDPVAELQVLGPAVWHLHAKDKTLRGQSVPLGAGDVDFTGVFEQLARQGFAGFITLEATRGEDPICTAASHRDFLLAAAQAASASQATANA